MERPPPIALTYRRATTADAPRVLAIIEEAARWLESRGLRQWNWYLTDAGLQSIPQRIERCEVYLVTCDGDDAATFSLQWTDRPFWGDRGEDGQAGYVHGLAVRRAFAGGGVGAAMLDRAERAVAARGRQMLRLDCMSENTALCGYYVRHGFAALDEQTPEGGPYRFRRFQRLVRPEGD